MNTAGLTARTVALAILLGLAGLLWMALARPYGETLARLQDETDLLLDEAALLSVRINQETRRQEEQADHLHDLVIVSLGGGGVIQLQDLLADAAKDLAVTLNSLEPLPGGAGESKTALRVRFTASEDGAGKLLYNLEARGTEGQTGPLVQIEQIELRKSPGAPGRATRPLDGLIILSVWQVTP